MNTLYDMLGFLSFGTCIWERTSKCYKRSLRHELSFGHSRCMSETQAACNRCNPWRMLLDWLSWTYLDHAKIYRDCVHAISKEHISWLSSFYHAALMTLSRRFCLLLVLFPPAVHSSSTWFHPGNIPIATAEFLISFRIKWQAKVIFISSYQCFLVNNFWSRSLIDVPDKIFLFPSNYPLHLPENTEPIKNHNVIFKIYNDFQRSTPKSLRHSCNLCSEALKL